MHGLATLQRLNNAAAKRGKKKSEVSIETTKKFLREMGAVGKPITQAYHIPTGEMVDLRTSEEIRVAKRKKEDVAFAIKYPEHAKQNRILSSSQPIGEFLDWAFNMQGWELCVYDGYVGRNYSIGKRIEEILAQYFDINLSKIEEEKRAMLEEIRAKS